MENKIQVNEQELMIKEYEGQRIVTMWDIARLHGVTTNNIRTNFKRNIHHLIEGEDYFLLEKTDNFVSTLSGNGELNQNTVNRAKDIPVFTEAGYLLMTKPMTDEISWKVQRQLVNCYFKVKEQVKSGIGDSEKVNAEAPKYILEDINKTLEVLTNMYTAVGVSSKETIDMTRVLLGKVGIELPEITSRERDVKNFIKLEEVAKRVGIYTPNMRPNKQAVVIILSKLNISKSLLYITTGINLNTNNETYEITYSPEIINLISDYLSENKYPECLEKITNSGTVIRCSVVYEIK